MDSLKKISPLELFKGFASVGLRGFGGVMPFVYAEFVEKRQWITPQDFAELIAMGQLLPGPNVTNFASMFGYRVCGRQGVVAAISGLLGPPAILIIIICSIYQKYSTHPEVIGALHGMMAVSAGLIFVTGIKMLKSQPKNFFTFLFCFLGLLGVGFFRLPLIYVLGVLGPLSLLIEWKRYK